MAHHPRYRRRVLTGRPGSHPVYARVAELRRDRDFERIDAIYDRGRWLVSQQVYDALKTLPERKVDDFVIGRATKPEYVTQRDPIAVMASFFNSTPIEVCPYLPRWEKRRRRISVVPPEPRPTMTLAEGTAKLVELMSKMRPADPPALPKGTPRHGDFYDPGFFWCNF